MTEAPAAPKPTSLYGALTLPLRVLGSLQVTVALFALGMVLVFFGTMAQVNDGIWTVVSQYFWSSVVWIPTDLVAKFLQVFFWFPKDTGFAGHFPFPAGKLLGGLMFVNLFAAHTKQLLDLIRVAVKQRAKQSAFTAVAVTLLKRSGIYVIHGGLLLLFVGEYITREFQIEQRMQIAEGQTVNWSEDTRAWELFVEDKAAGTVTVIPHTRLKAGETLRAADLPADIEVIEYFPNSEIKDAAGRENRATAGFGLGFVALKLPVVSGVDPNQRIDMPAAYVRLKAKDGSDLGTYITSVWQTMAAKAAPEMFTVAGKSYEIGLRCKRYYKPYSLHLIDFKFDRYVGTNTAKNYSSEVRLIDPRHDLDRVHVIAMNEPLRYDGDAFYQSSFEPDESGTILQVVENPGWVLPYLSCAMVTVGMLLHFGLKLLAFLRAAPKVTAVGQPSAFASLFTPASFVAAGVAAVYLLSVFGRMTPAREPYDLAAAAKIPVVESGREQPLDTFARVSLRMISGRETYKDLDGNTQPAIKWFFEVAANGSPDRNDRPMKFKVVKIENKEVLAVLGLPERSGLLYAIDEFKDKVPVLSEKANAAAQRPQAQRDLFDRQILLVAERVKLYVDIATAQKPLTIPPAEDREWTTFPDSLQAIQQQSVARARATFGADLQHIEQLPQEKQVEIADYFRKEMDRLIDDDPATKFWRAALRAYRQEKGEDFNRAVAAYDFGGVGSPGQAGRNSVEATYNRFAPFYQALYLYGTAIGLVVVGWVMRLFAPGDFRRNTFWLLAFAFVVHTVALAARVYIQGRPPVTNLYSSAIYIGWGCVALGLLLELLYPIGVGNAVAAGLGLLTTIVSHQLGAGGDNMEMMQAVLDTNFWLATHVVCISSGYVATYVAGAIAVYYVVAGVFTPSLDDRTTKFLRSMLYGVLAFALLLSFVGTVLGGIWADQSWGRFWGWDPKENGAVLIVLWNALILHARWAGLIKLRGMAVLALVGNCVTTWSWFGTNQLGIGLHNYGFDNTLAMVCSGLWVLHAGLIALGCVPAKLWASRPA